MCESIYAYDSLININTSGEAQSTLVQKVLHTDDFQKC